MASYDQAARILKQSAVENTVTVMVQYNPDSKFLLYNIASFRGLLLLWCQYWYPEVVAERCFKKLWKIARFLVMKTLPLLK